MIHMQGREKRTKIISMRFLCSSEVLEKVNVPWTGGP